MGKNAFCVQIVTDLYGLVRFCTLFCYNLLVFFPFSPINVILNEVKNPVYFVMFQTHHPVTA